MPSFTLSPICSLSSWAMRCIMSMTNLPMAVVVSNLSCMEVNSLPLARRSSIISAKFTLFLWIRSIFRTRIVSQLRSVFLPEKPSSLYTPATSQPRTLQYASSLLTCASREKPSFAWSSVETLA